MRVSHFYFILSLFAALTACSRERFYVNPDSIAEGVAANSGGSDSKTSSAPEEKTFGTETPVTNIVITDPVPTSTPPPPVPPPGSIVPEPTQGNRFLETRHRYVTIPFESYSSLVNITNLSLAIPENAIITKISLRLRQSADEEGGTHFYLFQHVGVFDTLVQLKSFNSDATLSPNRATNQRVRSTASDFEYILLESTDGSSVLSPNVVNAADFGFQLQYYNYFYKSNSATVDIEEIELAVEYHF